MLNKFRVHISNNVYNVLCSVDFCVCIANKRNRSAYLKTFERLCPIVWLRPRDGSQSVTPFPVLISLLPEIEPFGPKTVALTITYPVLCTPVINILVPSMLGIHMLNNTFYLTHL